MFPLAFADFKGVCSEKILIFTNIFAKHIPEYFKASSTSPPPQKKRDGKGEVLGIKNLDFFYLADKKVIR